MNNKIFYYFYLNMLYIPSHMFLILLPIIIMIIIVIIICKILNEYNDSYKKEFINLNNVYIETMSQQII
jgi:hypothetical protein